MPPTPPGGGAKGAAARRAGGLSPAGRHRAAGPARHIVPGARLERRPEMGEGGERRGGPGRRGGRGQREAAGSGVGRPAGSWGARAERDAGEPAAGPAPPLPPLRGGRLPGRGLARSCPRAPVLPACSQSSPGALPPRSP